MMGPRLLYVIPSLQTGGAELQTINHVNYLFSEGYEVRLIVLSRKNENIDQLNPEFQHVSNLGISALPPIGVSLILKMPGIVLRLLKLIEKGATWDVIAILPSAHFVMRVVKFFRPKLSLHSYYRALYYEMSPMKSAGKRFFNGFNKYLARRMDTSSIFISNHVYHDIQKNFHTPNPLIIPNSLPPKQVDSLEGKSFLAENNLETEYLILFPGRLHFAKGHIFFLEQFKKLIVRESLSSRKVRLLIVGDGSEKKSICTFIEANSLSPFVKMTGPLRNQLLLSLYKCSDLVVIPSLHEGFGNVAIEGLMQGSLMLASNAGGLGEIIRDGENGFVFEKGNTNNLLDKLTMIYQNRTKKLVDSTRLEEEFFRRYTIGRQMDDLLNHIEKFPRK